MNESREIYITLKNKETSAQPHLHPPPPSLNFRPTSSLPLKKQVLNFAPLPSGSLMEIPLRTLSVRSKWFDHHRDIFWTSFPFHSIRKKNFALPSYMWGCLRTRSRGARSRAAHLHPPRSPSSELLPLPVASLLRLSLTSSPSSDLSFLLQGMNRVRPWRSSLRIYTP